MCLYSFVRVAVTKCRTRSGFINRHALSHGSGGQKSKATVSAGLVPSEPERVGISFLPPSSFRRFEGYPWRSLVSAISLQPLPSSSHSVLAVCASVSTFPFL